MRLDPDHLVTDPDALQALYGEPGEASLKEVDHVHPHYRAFIEASPRHAGHGGPDGLDASPRGDQPDSSWSRTKTLLPDRRGSNRIDSLHILADPRVALLFLVPGVGETLRVNGLGRISTDPALLERFGMDGKLPRSVRCRCGARARQMPRRAPASCPT